MNRSSERGSAIIMLFILAALLAALSWAFFSSTRTSLSWVDSEKNKSTQTMSQECTNAFNSAMKRLDARGCGAAISLLASGENTKPGAPSDGSCSIFHPAGGGLKPCNNLALLCELESLAIGQTCGNAVYVGVVGGSRMYVHTSRFTERWNNGSDDPPWTSVGASSNSNGKANTDTLVGSVDPGAPYLAATGCRAIGSEWYLPAESELEAVYDVKDTGDLDTVVDDSATMDSIYWSSTENGNHVAVSLDLSDGNWNIWDTKNNPRSVMCVRRD